MSKHGLQAGLKWSTTAGQLKDVSSADNLKRFLSRVDEHIAEKQQRLGELRSKAIVSELKDCSFSPVVCADGVPTVTQDLVRPRSRPSVTHRASQLSGEAQREEADRMFIESLRKATPVNTDHTSQPTQPQPFRLSSSTTSQPSLIRRETSLSLPPLVPLKQTFDNLRALSVKKYRKKLRLFTHDETPSVTRPADYGIVRLQAIWRGACVRERVRYEQRCFLAATMIQGAFLRWKERRVYAARVIQKTWKFLLAEKAVVKAGVVYLASRVARGVKKNVVKDVVSSQVPEKDVINEVSMRTPRMVVVIPSNAVVLPPEESPVTPVKKAVTKTKGTALRPEWRGVIDFDRREVIDKNRTYVFEGKGKRRFDKP